MAAPLPFETAADFEPLADTNPVIAARQDRPVPDDWAAAAHYVVVDETVHYLWGARDIDTPLWRVLHSTAPRDRPWDVTDDPANPVLSPVDGTFDQRSAEYPVPFEDPADGEYYAYYLARGDDGTAATGLVTAAGGDLSRWTRVRDRPVIAATEPYEERGAAHPSAVVDGDTVHIVYTARSGHGEFTLCHATAPTADPADVTKNPDNPVFTGSSDPWDADGVREGELYLGPEYVHLFYGGRADDTWRVGHARTTDFSTFEANPANPVLSGTEGTFDERGVLTPFVREIDGRFLMAYAGTDGSEAYGWQTGVATVETPTAGAR